MGAFLRNYVIVFPAVIAVMNGVLAVFSTHYPFDTPASKLAFIAIIISLSVAAIGATFYSQHLIVAERAKDRANIIKIREMFGTFMVDGDQLLCRFLDPNDTTVVADANQWLELVGTFLIKELGQSYFARFQNSSGTPTVVPAVEAITNERRNYWVYINQRLARIEQFSEGLHSSPLVK